MNLRMGSGNIYRRCGRCTVYYIIITVKCDCWCFDLKRSTSVCVARHCGEKGFSQLLMSLDRNKWHPQFQIFSVTITMYSYYHHYYYGVKLRGGKNNSLDLSIFCLGTASMVVNRWVHVLFLFRQAYRWVLSKMLSSEKCDFDVLHTCIMQTIG